MRFFASFLSFVTLMATTLAAPHATLLPTSPMGRRGAKVFPQFTRGGRLVWGKPSAVVIVVQPPLLAQSEHSSQQGDARDAQFTTTPVVLRTASLKVGHEQDVNVRPSGDNLKRTAVRRESFDALDAVKRTGN